MTALSGIRVVDFTRVISGPYATMVLADLGAEVIKVERPGTGDDARAFGPPFVDGESTYFMSVNRGKKSVVIDLGTDEGRATARCLALTADVVIENFRPGYMARVDLDYESLSRERPGLVYCSISAFGESGPYRDRPGYDVMVSALGGMMGMTGHPGGPPAKTAVGVLDLATGLHAATAICAALVERERSGRGQRVELSLLEVQLATLINAASAYLVGGEVMGPQGNGHSSIAPYKALHAQDGYVVIGAANDRMFARLCAVMDLPALLDDPRFASNALRVDNDELLNELLEAKLSERTVADWVERIGAAGVAVAPVNRIDEVFADPQVIASHAVHTYEHSVLGPVELVGSPLHLSRTPVSPSSAPPGLLGQHTAEVLSGSPG